MGLRISKQVVDNLEIVRSMDLDLNGYLKTLSLTQTPSGDILLYDPQPTLRDCNTNGPLLQPKIYYTLTERREE